MKYYGCHPKNIPPSFPPSLPSFRATACIDQTVKRVNHRGNFMPTRGTPLATFIITPPPLFQSAVEPPERAKEWFSEERRNGAIKSADKLSDPEVGDGPL